MTFEAQLFDPRSGNTSRVTVQIFGTSLEILRAGSDALRVDPGKCSLQAGGWDQGALQVTWPAEGGAWALSTKDPSAMTELMRIPRFQERLATAGRAHRKAAAHGRLGLFLVAVIVFLPLIAIGFVYAYRDPLIDIVLKRIPVSVDQEVGRLFEGDLTGPNAVLADSEASRAIKAIVARLEKSNSNQSFTFRVSIQKNAEVNAFAAPGGLIVVYTGLIKEAGSADEVAGVLAHEMAHATKRHSMRQLIYTAGVLPLVGFLIGSPDAASLFRDVSQLSELRFSRQQEEDADLTGFDTLVAAGLPPEGMARFFDRLNEKGLAAPSFLSTHPASADRAAAIRKRAEASKPAPGQPLDIDWGKVKASVN